MAARALLFDLDGTVWDSHPMYERALGPDGSGVAARLRDGDNLIQIVRMSGVSKRAFTETCSELAADALYPGVHDTVEALSARGTQLGVVTNLPAWLAIPILAAARLGEAFSVIETAAGKPGASGLLRAADSIAPARGPTWFVGDGLADAAAARAAHIEFAWTSYGYLAERPDGAAERIDRFEDVLEL